MTEKVLIVDDSATARALFKACFSENSNYVVLETGDWQEAVSIAKKEQPFLVVLDYNMPEKVGPEIAQEIQKAGVKTRFVLMSANTQESVVKEVEALGFIDIIEKPITAEAVQSMLEKLS